MARGLKEEEEEEGREEGGPRATPVGMGGCLMSLTEGRQRREGGCALTLLKPNEG